ncbi:MAG: hypothetical protein OSA43_12545, partial [Pirellulales bacterium]|nr:hypothetical protein [Pirellulales bacterium]
IAMYGQGCCGNINSFPLRKSLAHNDIAGRTLGDATLKAIEESEPIAATELTLRKEQIHIPTRPLPSPELVAELKEKNKDNPARLKQLNKISAAQYELWIDRHAPFKHNMVFALTNGGRAYIGTDQALAMGANGGYEAACLPNWGGHETMSPHLGPPKVGCEKMIHQAFESLWERPSSKPLKAK